MCGTLSNVCCNKAKFGLSPYPPSIKCSQCQTVARNALKCSPNEDIKHLWKSTSTHKNLQCDRYKDTKEVLVAFRSSQEERLHSQIVLQGSFFSAVISKSLLKPNSIWSSAQSNLPTNISTLQFDTSIILSQLGRIFPNGHLLPHLSFLPETGSSSSRCSWLQQFP